jgi:ATP-dependent DNA helicase RecG
MNMNYTIEQLQHLVSQGESATLEFKATTGELKEGCQTLSGMLNHKGGKVLFGVKNDGRLVGQQVTEKTLRDMQSEIRKIEPVITPDITVVRLSDMHSVIVVEATRQTKGPFVYDGRPFIRPGNVTHSMSQEQYQQLLTEKMHASSRWELLPASGGIGLNNLDLTEVVTTLEDAIAKGRQADPFTRDPKTILRGFGLLTDDQLTNAAIALFIKDEAVLPAYAQLRLRLARFRGIDKSEFIDSKQFHGNAFRQLQHAQQFLLQHLPIAGRVVPGVIERQDDPVFPLLALREAIANAICHRDYELGGGSVAIAIYDDRLEITSSGDLHFGLTAAALYQEHESLPWNPLIASVFHKRGIIETWGRGTLIIKEQTEKAGLVAPVIETTGGCVTVRFLPTRYNAPLTVLHDLSIRQKALLDFLGRYPETKFAMSQLVQAFEAHQWTDRMLREDLQFLKQLNLVTLDGHGAGARWSIKNG